ncbi:MAG: hypothetical protein ACR2RA_04100 [Geminicoccaceae bacterium]
MKAGGGQCRYPRRDALMHVRRRLGARAVKPDDVIEQGAGRDCPASISQNSGRSASK